MLNRLKAAIRLVFSTNYIVLTLDQKTGNGNWSYSRKPSELQAFAALCLSESREVTESRTMNNLVEQANSILSESK